MDYKCYSYNVYKISIGKQNIFPIIKVDIMNEFCIKLFKKMVKVNFGHQIHNFVSCHQYHMDVVYNLSKSNILFLQKIAYYTKISHVTAYNHKNNVSTFQSS